MPLDNEQRNYTTVSSSNDENSIIVSERISLEQHVKNIISGMQSILPAMYTSCNMHNH